MNPNRYCVSLRFFHPSISPEKITTALGLSPERAWQVGEPRTTPKGTPLEGNNRQSCWSAEIAKGRWPGRSLGEAISEALNQLSGQKEFFNTIRSEGGRAEFFIGWFFEGQGGDIFDAALMGRLAELKIDLSLDIYPPDQPQIGA